MPNYRRAWHPGGTYFFTVNLLQRHNNDLLIRKIDILRQTVKSVKQRHPFAIHAGRLAQSSALRHGVANGGF